MRQQGRPTYSQQRQPLLIMAKEASLAKKKQLPLRISARLYAELAAWAEADFRSLNGQIEYLLTECVRHRKKGQAGSVKDG